MLRGAFFTVALLIAFVLSAEARTPRPFTQNHGDGLTFGWPYPTLNEEVLDTYLARIAKSGAKHLTIPMGGCQPDALSSEVGSCTLTDEKLSIAIAKAALSKGFRVTFLPIVFTPGGEWRGEFNPKNRARWFETYTSWIVHVAEIAESLRMPSFNAGSEFKILFHYGEEWKKVLASVRTVFSGPVFVTANWDDLELPFWEESDAIGFSNYFPLSNLSNPDQSVLDLGAQKIRSNLLAISRKYNRPLYMTEVGYPSLPTAVTKPWYYARTESELISDPQLQAKCFTAFTRAWKDDTTVLHVGVWATSDYLSDYSAFNYEVLNKPAESVLKDFFVFRGRVGSSRNL